MKNLTSFIVAMAMVSAAFFLVISITISQQANQLSQYSPDQLIAHRASGRMEILVAHRASGRMEIAHRASGRLEAWG
jgi:small-conductance mechanosensitive channel